MQSSIRRDEQFTCPTRGCLAPILAEYGGERPRNPAWGDGVCSEERICQTKKENMSYMQLYGQMVLSRGRMSSERYSVRRKDFWAGIATKSSPEER